MRINKYLAKAGLASRRKCDELIKKGLININGVIIDDLATQVKENDYVLYKNKLVQFKFNPVVYLLNKPKGVISTVNDPQNRKTIMDFFQTEERLFPIGRLDRDTTGVILVTNDGDLAHKLMHPKYKIERKYIVHTKLNINKNKLKSIINGVLLENGQKVKANINFLEKKFNRFVFEAILYEGKNREVKNIFKFLDSRVESLHRSSFAGIVLGKLKTGHSKKISLNIIRKIINT